MVTPRRQALACTDLSALMGEAVALVALTKLGVSSRTEAVALAMRHHLVT